MKRNNVPGALLRAALAVMLMALMQSCSGKDETDPNELLVILGDVALSENQEPGRWSVPGLGKPATRLNEEEIERLAKLETLPYLQGYRNASGLKNVTVHDSVRAYPGVNLYTSGHAPEAFAIDMDGSVLHRWRFDIETIWPSLPKTVHSTFWRRVFWFPNGDILAIYEGIGIIKLDRESNLIWAYRGGCHHEAQVADDGSIAVLTRRAEIIPRLNPDQPVLHDWITVLSPDGTVREEYSLLECFERSSFRHLLRGMRRAGDIFHTNTVSIFDGSLVERSHLFKAGNALISLLKLDVIAIVDLKGGTVVWAESGRNNRLWRAQHDPKLLANGNILLFDNVGQFKQSKVLEYDPLTRRAVWNYAGDDETPLFSRTCGVSQRLPNGNTLITESDNGRALEVTPGKEIVWEFYNPHRAGERDELIATLFEMKRVNWENKQWLRTHTPVQ